MTCTVLYTYTYIAGAKKHRECTRIQTPPDVLHGPAWNKVHTKVRHRRGPVVLDSERKAKQRSTLVTLVC